MPKECCQLVSHCEFRLPLAVKLQWVMPPVLTSLVLVTRLVAFALLHMSVVEV